jgi:hypothetical protein
MDRLNYFNPYQSIEGHYENQLTRAYMVLLRYSFHAFASFFDYCKSKHNPVTAKDEDPMYLNQLLGSDWEIQTQKGNPTINTDWLLSILITDSEIIKEDQVVEISDRNAVYDGLISFGNKITFIIENKPRSANVWFNQLKPSRENLAEETLVYSQPIVLEWKEIIKHLNLLLSAPALAGQEKMMIGDFLEYVDQEFPYLNPFDNFSLCKGNHELIQRRIANILKSIVLDESLVKYHRNWGYYIETPFWELQEIGLILDGGKEWHLNLSLYFGATQSQARTFYGRALNIDALIASGWEIKPNFHISFRSSNLVWFPCCEPLKYIAFWEANKGLIKQQKRPDVRKYLDDLYEIGILEKSAETEQTLADRFFNTKMPNLNMCPELGMLFLISKSDAEERDKAGTLLPLLKDKIREVLNAAGLDPNTIIKS